MTPATRPKPRRNETRELVRPIMAAVNALPGVRVWRPHVLNTRALDLAGAGLAEGSADLVGLALCTWTEDDGYLSHEFGRFLALEAKWPGEHPTADQRLWAAVVRKLGGFYAVVRSVEEAVDAVTRCREGMSE
jgi:hypothetical protein